MGTCPKCGAERHKGSISCQDCGIVYSKYFASKKAEKHGMPLHKKSNSSTRKTYSENQNMKKNIIAVVVLLCIGASWWFMSNLYVDEKEKAPIVERRTLTAVEREHERLQRDEECKKTLECWGKRYDTAAFNLARDRIERMAMNEFKWTDGVLESKISKVRWLDKQKLTVTYIGDKLQVQNDYGAFKNYIYFCDYDPINDKLLDVRVIAGKL